MRRLLLALCVDGCSDGYHRVMTNKKSMPAIEGVTIGMTHDNCMGHCFSQDPPIKFFGECRCYKA